MAYQYQPVYAPPDPTNVVGRRVGAAVIDMVMHGVLNAVVFFLLAHRVARVVTFGSGGGAVFRGRRWEMSGGHIGLYYLIALGALAVHYGWLQGTTGHTVGKLATGVRVVRADGQVPGVGLSLLRTVVWIVDAAPWCIPGLVGFILVLTSKGHRRLGDMAANTYVVAEQAAGYPVMVPGATGPAGPPPGWSPPPPPGWSPPPPPDPTPPGPDQGWPPPPPTV
jgi:uncharacterized RDD family membrane protein YckC